MNIPIQTSVKWVKNATIDSCREMLANFEDQLRIYESNGFGGNKDVADFLLKTMRRNLIKARCT